MAFRNAAILSTLASFALCTPLLKRDDPGYCTNPAEATLNTDYFDCSHANSLNSDGSCGGNPTMETNCNNYCEVKKTYFLGREQPFDDSAMQGCGQGENCQLQESKSTTVTSEFSIDLGGTGESEGDLTGALDIGAGWSWGQSLSYTTTQTYNQPSSMSDWCGYWTLVPYYVTSCGSLSEWGSSSYDIGGEQVPLCGSGTPSTVGNWCNSSPYKGSDGKAGGVVVFVAQNCTTHALAPMDQQDPTYQVPGVSSPRT